MKTENEMTDEELQEHESKTEVVLDRFDKLEMLRQLLCDSHIEKMFYIKRASNLGPICPYYLKAKQLFENHQLDAILKQIKEIL